MSLAWCLWTLLAVVPPPDEWLVAQGTREGCTITRAFDLASGAAFLLDDCKGRGRMSTGRVPPATAAGAVRQLLAPGDRPAGAPGLMTWALARQDGSIVVGEAALPFRALDAAFVEGCAPAAPPPYTRLVAEVPSMATPVSADAAQALFQAYRDAREYWLAMGTCAAGR